MYEKLARLIFEHFDLRFEPDSVNDELIASVSQTIQKRFSKPNFPNRGESLAVSVMTPKTAALAFDRVHSDPARTPPIPEEVGFYCATWPEIASTALGVMLVTLREVGIRNDKTVQFFENKINEKDAAANEARSLRLLCSELSEEIGVMPTIFFHHSRNMRKEFPSGPQQILMAAISNVAMVDESKLTWEQVIEFRRDDKARAKYRRFVRWADYEMTARSPQELEDIIAMRLDDYSWSLKKHGMTATLGAISCLLDPKFLAAMSAATAATAAVGGVFGAALTATTLTVGKALVSFGKEMVDGLDERRKGNYEIAYVYDIKKRLA